MSSVHAGAYTEATMLASKSLAAEQTLELDFLVRTTFHLSLLRSYLFIEVIFCVL